MNLSLEGCGYALGNKFHYDFQLLFWGRNIYLGKFLYFLKTHFALRHKHKDNTTVALEK